MASLRKLIDRVKQNAGNQSSYLWEFIGITLLTGYVWILAGYEKIAGGIFVSNLVKTLKYFGSNNPYKWYVSYLNSVAIPNYVLLGTLVQYAEFLAGLMLVAGTIIYFLNANQKLRRWIRRGMIVAFAGLALMSANFYFAAGWTSVSTGELNVIMFWIELIFLASWIKMGSKK